jgi:hypothetical protein
MQIMTKGSGASVGASSPATEELSALVDETKKQKKGGKSGKTFKRVKRGSGDEKKDGGVRSVEKKRSRDEETEMDVDEDARIKVGRFVGDADASHSKLAGPADRSCETQ